MKHKPTLAAALALAALAVPAALAGPPPGKGKPPATGPGCKPQVTVVLKGTLKSDPGPGATSFSLEVNRANKHGRSLVTSPPTTVTVTVGAATKVRRRGAKTIDALALGDQAVVQIRRCKGDLPLTAETVDDVAASRVTARPPTPSTP